jgi:phosphoribosylanthranilate isomerase
MKIKVCGIAGETAERDIELLARARVDAVGLWHGVPGGDADLSRRELVRYAGVARAHEVEPVIVTFESDAAALGRAVGESGARWVQLHAYQLPRVVHELKTSVRRLGVNVVKVLHVRDNRCVDLRLVAAYERAGVDAFLLDVATHDGRVGSTGESIPPDVTADLAGHLSRPFYLAGGLSATERGSYEELTRHPGFAGIDVHTGARDAVGRLRAQRIDAIDQAWRGVRVR